MTLSQIIHELQTLRKILPADAPVSAWLLSPAAGVPEMAVFEICGVTGGVHRASDRIGATLQLRLPHSASPAPVLKPVAGMEKEAA